MASVTATYLGNAKSILSNSARAMRRARSDFVLKPEDLARYNEIDPAQLAKLIVASGGDPAAMSKALGPGMVARIRDGAQFLYVNNLLWGWRTHFVNMTTNLYMVGGRPMERIIGSFATGAEAGQRIRAENFKQYHYMGASLHDAWTAAVQTYKSGDSVMSPHNANEAVNMGGSTGKAIAEMPWKEMDSVGNILHNALAFGAKAIGQPTRLLGTVDELVKQTVYRSKVQSMAFVDGAEQGLKGQDLTDYVKKALMDSFDDEGRALDTRALQEAMVSTFQQELLPGTIGRSVANFTASQPWSRFILPFVRTPTNVLRMGIKMTPGLNVLQTEYRAMISGSMGPEMQAQAVGQMSMGALFMGTAAHLAHSGMMTGGGPTDRAERDLLLSTGWQPYSFVRTGPNGEKTYVPYGRYDPIAMPFGIIADIVAALHAVDPDDETVADRAQTVMTGALVSLAKQFGNKTYLMSINQAMDAVMDPDRNMGKTAGTMASNFIPFASNLRQFNQDPYMRDARDFADKFIATIPGLSETIPPKRDVWGDPRSTYKGLWVSTPADEVDAEVRRMVEDSGMVIGPVPPVRNGADLRDIVMEDGRNAYDRMVELSAQPGEGAPRLKQVVGEIMATEAYKVAPDGAAEVKGTKQAMIAGTISNYRDAAFQQLRADKNVREALLAREQAVADAYATQRGKETGAVKPAERRQVEELGASLGVDLGGILGSN